MRLSETRLAAQKRLNNALRKTEEHEKPMSKFYANGISSILNQFNSDLEQGLSLDALQKARARHGKNELGATQKTGQFAAFLKSMLSWRVLVFAVATAVLIVPFIRPELSLVAAPQAKTAAGVLGAMLILHIGWACFSEYCIRRREEQIHEHLGLSVQVIRQGKLEKCPPQDIVPGDLISVSTGDYIPADARIVEADGLLIDEAGLFGTEDPVQKTSDTLSDEPAGGEGAATSIPPEKQKNMVFAGTYVEVGSGQAIVVQIGKQTEFWKQRPNARPTPDATTYAEGELKFLHNLIKIAGVCVAGLVVAIAWWVDAEDQGKDWFALLHLGVLFILAAAPQDAVSLIRLNFSQHARELLKKGVALRNPRSLEKLSRITTFCANEKGLSTTRALALSYMFVDEQLVEETTWNAWLRSLQNLSVEEKKQAVNAIQAAGHHSQIPPSAAGLVLTAALGVSGKRHQLGKRSDEDTSPRRVLQKQLQRLGYELKDLKANLPLVNEYPWTSRYGYQMGVLESGDENYLNIIFGEAQKVLDVCDFTLTQGEVIHLQDERYHQYRDALAYLQSLSSQRALGDVYGVASQSSEVMLTPQDMAAGSTFLGFIAFSVSDDEETKAVVKSSLDTGLKIILITERDEQQTGVLAKALGLIHTGKAVASREVLDSLSREALDEKVRKCLAYSQPNREQRRGIVFGLKRHGHTVGFLGESGTDLRAMMAADIAFANRQDASDIAQAQSDGLILKRGFRAVRDGLLHAREAYQNLAGSIRWGLSCTLALPLTLVFGTILHYVYHLPMPLTFPQVAWVQLLVSLFPTFGAGCEQIFADEKYHRPAMFSVSRFLPKIAGLDIVCRGVTISLMSLIPFFFMLWRSDLEDSEVAIARTMVATMLIFTQLATCWQALRYPWESLFQRMFANTRLLIIFLVIIGLHLAALYVTPISELIGLTPLKWEWQWTLLFSFTLFLLPLNLAINPRPHRE